jgi:hypothetical protein
LKPFVHELGVGKVIDGVPKHLYSRKRVDAYRELCASGKATRKQHVAFHADKFCPRTVAANQAGDTRYYCSSASGHALLYLDLDPPHHSEHRAHGRPYTLEDLADRDSTREWLLCLLGQHVFMSADDRLYLNLRGFVGRQLVSKLGAALKATRPFQTTIEVKATVRTQGNFGCLGRLPKFKNLDLDHISQFRDTPPADAGWVSDLLRSLGHKAGGTVTTRPRLRLHQADKRQDSEERGEEERQNTSVSHPHLDQVVRACIPSGPGERNSCLLALVRSLDDAGLGRDHCDAAFELWYTQSHGVIHTKDREFNRRQFIDAWERSQRRCAEGQAPGCLEDVGGTAELVTVPDIFEKPVSLATIYRYCHAFQVRAGDAPFFFSSWLAAELAVVSQSTAYRHLKHLRRLGVLELVRVGDSYPGGKASEWRFRRAGQE